MGSGMAKCSSSEMYYKRQRGTQNHDSCFNKEYSEYWSKDTRKGAFGMEKNNYSFNSGPCDGPKPRRQSSFISSFSAENSSGYGSNSSSPRYK